MNKTISFIMVVLLAVAMCVTASLATVTQVDGLDGTYTHIANVTFGADTDVYQSVTHGLGGTAAEYEYTITPLDINCTMGLNSGGYINTAMPYINDVSTTTIGVAKANIQRSATCAVRVMIRNIHSIIK